MGLPQCGIIWLINLPILITYLLDIVLDIIGRSYTSITNLRVKGIRHSKIIGTEIQHLTTHKLFSRVLIMSSTKYCLIITFPIYLTQKFKDNILRVTLHTDRPKMISQHFSTPCSIWSGILLDILSVLHSSYVQIISYIVCLRGNSQFS